MLSVCKRDSSLTWWSGWAEVEKEKIGDSGDTFSALLARVAR